MRSVGIAIVDDDMVGLTATCGLQGNGLRVAALKQHVPEPLTANVPSQLYVSTISAVSEKLLARPGVWQNILLRRTYCHHGTKVWDKGSFGHIPFDNQSMGYNRLRHIVKNPVIHYALWNKA